jgi:hypothetical protein
MNTEEFISKAIISHGNKYDYSLVDYYNCHEMVNIICPVHGVFKQKPYLHLSGRGCSMCARNKKYTFGEFCKKADTIHSSRYRYIRFVDKRKVEIECKVHGVFMQNITLHLSGRGCPDCCNNRKLTNEDFLKRAVEKHGDKYDYSLVDYDGCNGKVTIICPEHGKFLQTARWHLSGRGCRKCGGSFNICYSDFLKRAVEKHGDKYDYSKSEETYSGTKSKILIICPEHGEFWQTPESHMIGKGCRKCGNYRAIKSMRFKISDFQKEVYEYCLQLDNSFVNGCKNVIKGYELDIFSNKHNLAIECHGMYFHSCGCMEEVKKRKYRHFDKCDLSNVNNIRLIQIYEYEWIYKREIVCDIIRHALGMTTKRIYARNYVLLCLLLNIRNLLKYVGMLLSVVLL